MKVAILNVKYSPNLGDGVIAECIEDQLSKRIDGLEIFSIDIGGKDDYGSGGSIMGEKLGLMGRVRQLPDFIQKPIKEIAMPLAVDYKYGALWKEKLAGCDALIIGGGHLFMDVDQYFPMRILAAVKQAAKGIPLVVYAVGVSKKMTARGLGMFRQIFKHGQLIQASVRDSKSQDNWEFHFNGPRPLLCRDPGLLAVETYGIGPHVPRPDAPRKIIAFGVSDPASMLPHSDSAEGVVCGDINFYLQALTLIAPNHDVRMFTNGEDQEYLEKVAAAIKTLPADIQKNITVLPRALKPIQLVKQITDADALIAHRLHANILAYSHGIPHIGLGWDEKLKSFFAAIDRPDFVITSNQNAPAKVADLLERSLREGVDKDKHNQVLAEVRAGMDDLAAVLVRKVNDK